MHTERVFYNIGKVVLIFLIVLIIVLKLTDLEVLNILPDCAFYSMTGIVCPGCGGTRSVKFLLRGDIVRCFLYHPFVLYCLSTYTIFMVYEFIKVHCKKVKKVFPVEILCCVGVGVLILQWIVKVVLQFVL